MQVQEKILDAARDVFVRDGYEAASLRKIAEAIEYTPAAIYTHFKDKADLLRTLCRRDYGALSAHVLHLNQIEHPIRRIAELGYAYVRFAVEHPHHYRFMFMTPLPADVEPDPEDVAAMNDPDQDGYAALRHACTQGIERGMFRPELKDADLIAQTLWAGVHGVASLEITHAADPCIGLRPLEERTSTVINAVLRGLTSEAGARGLESEERL